MAGPWDDFFKTLVGKCPAQYAEWVEKDVEFLETVNVELKIKHRFADALLKVKREGLEGLLHFEFQLAKDPEMEERMHEYSLMASRQHGLPVSSYVVYLRKHRKLPRSPHIRRFLDGEETHRFHYRVIKLWDIQAEELLELGLEGLLPFLPLTKGGKKPELIQAMVDRLVEQNQWELLQSAFTLGGLVFDKPHECERFERNFLMHEDIFRESRTYQRMSKKLRDEARQEGRQEGQQEGRQQGLQEGRQKTILLIMQARFPELVALVKSQVEQIRGEATLNALTLRITTAQTGEEVLQFLASVSPHMSMI